MAPHSEKIARFLWAKKAHKHKLFGPVGPSFHRVPGISVESCRFSGCDGVVGPDVRQRSCARRAWKRCLLPKPEQAQACMPCILI